MNIKEKIQKLLSLAKSPNENEAKAALLKAKELMAVHKLDESEFEENDKELVHLVCKDTKWTTDSGNIWMVELCELVANNYCCTAAWHTPPKSRTHILVITGFKQDANVCKEVMEYVTGFVSNQIEAAQKRYAGNKRSIGISYASGFTEGLRMAYDQWNDEHSEWGLVMCKPEEVSSYENALGSKNVSIKKSNTNAAAYIRGTNDGRNFNVQRVLAKN